MRSQRKKPEADARPPGIRSDCSGMLTALESLWWHAENWKRTLGLTDEQLAQVLLDLADWYSASDRIDVAEDLDQVAAGDDD